MAFRKKIHKRPLQLAPHKKISKRLQSKEGEDRKMSYADWEGLPEDLVEDISKRLSLVSCVSFGSVCKSWQRIVAELPHFQTRDFPSLVCVQSKAISCRSMIGKGVWEMELPEVFGRYYCWGSFQDWLIMVDVKRGETMKICLWNPFSGNKIELPTASYYGRIFLSTSPTKANCVIMLLDSDGTKIACLNPGSQAWLELSLPMNLEVDDAIFCNGCFYFVTAHYNVLEIKSINSTANGLQVEHRFNLTEISEIVKILNRPTMPVVRKYLVESCGEVLLVCRFYVTESRFRLETGIFEVFKLDVKQMAWKKVENLGDRNLFVGHCGSISVSSSELSVGRANCIYFTGDRPVSRCNDWWTPVSYQPPSLDDWSVFSLDDKSFSGSVFSLDDKSFNGNSCHRGDTRKGVPVWIMAPVWWYLKKKNLIKWS